MFKNMGQTWSEAAGEIIIMLLIAFILGYLLRMLLSKGSSDATSKLEGELSSMKSQNGKLKKDLESCENSKKSALAAAAAVSTPVSTSAPLGDSVKDDLKKVEGIGPKIQELLNEGGIYSFNQLATASVDRLKEILSAAGPRFQIHAPDSWPLQASLAAEGKWDELKKWQDEHKGGRL